jgi:egghead protein (zeste-white 4 protein)
MPTKPLRTALPTSRRPGWASFAVTFVVCFSVLLWVRWMSAPSGWLAWYVAVVWTMPVGIAAQGLLGALRTMRSPPPSPPSRAAPDRVDDLLIVVIPTVGRTDTLPALVRSVRSFCACLPSAFANVRVDVVVDEDAEALEQVRLLAANSPMVRVLTIPRYFATPNGTRFKARANHFAHLARLSSGEARPDVWLLHMDDDTSVGLGTGDGLAKFITTQSEAGAAHLHLAQGVLCYPRELSRNRFTWLADSVRPGCDLSIFAASTGGGTPRAGLHGELLLVRASVEAEIGWDFGPSALVEDAQFALEFCDRHPGRSGQFDGLSYGASPSTVRDFIRQRERWVWGLLQLLSERPVRLRSRILMMSNVGVWVCAPAAYPACLLLLGLLVTSWNTSPPDLLIGGVWAFNYSFYMWLYWEGLKVNTGASTIRHRLWWEPVFLVLASPLFAGLECIGICCGVIRFLTSTQMHFTVIAKPD